MTYGETHESLCGICLTQPLAELSIVYLRCKHIFHKDCLLRRLQEKWGGQHKPISTAYGRCPQCQEWAEPLNDAQTSYLAGDAKYLDEQIRKFSMERFSFEGLQDDPRLKDPASPYFEKPEEFAYQHLDYYQCQECRLPYFGGHRDCGAAIE